MNITGRLEDWRIVETYTKGAHVVVGNLFDDVRHRWQDGASINTSKILDMPDEPKEGDVVKTVNSLYLLGKKHIDNGYDVT